MISASAARGAVVGAHAPFLLNHLLLRREVLVLEAGVHHAVGFELDGRADGVPAHGGVVDGGVVGGERVGAAAVLPDDAGILLGGHLLGALEQHVLQEVRDAALAVHLVPGPHPVPDLEGDGRAPVVFQQQHLEAVVQDLLPDLHHALGRGCSGSGRKQGHEHQTGEAMCPVHRFENNGPGGRAQQGPTSLLERPVVLSTLRYVFVAIVAVGYCQAARHERA